MTDHERHVAESGTRTWLDGELATGIAARSDRRSGFYADGRPARMVESEFRRLVRRLRIFRQLHRLSFDSLLDVGSGSDVYPYLARQRFGVETYLCDFVHQTNLPTEMRLGKLDHAVTMNAIRLPFRDGAFDVVLSSEVLEHLVRPVEVIAELLRVARRYVVLTSLEALAPDRWRRRWNHHRVDVRRPHVERNFFDLAEIEAIFGDGLHHECLMHEASMPASAFRPAAEREATYATLADTDQLIAALCRAVSGTRHEPGSMGILLVKTQRGAPAPKPLDPERDPELARWIVSQAAEIEEYAWAALCVLALYEQRPEMRPSSLPTPDRPVAESLRSLLCCPDCRGALDLAPGGVRCVRCGEPFASDHGVPVLYPKRSTDDDLRAAIDALCGNDASRARIVRRVAARLRANEPLPSALRRAAWLVEDVLGFQGSGGDESRSTR